MKKILLILGWLFLSAAPLLAQDDDDQEEGAEKIRDKMNEFIQKRLDLSKDESSKFTPVFIRYFQEWRQTLRDTKGLPTLDRQQKVIELQVRFRSQFRDIIGQRRGDLVFEHQRRFIEEIRTLRAERLRNNPGRAPMRRRINSLL